jgi:hypothetical protein
MFHRKSGALQPILHTHLSLKALIVVFAKLNSSLSHGETHWALDVSLNRLGVADVSSS